MRGPSFLLCLIGIAACGRTELTLGPWADSDVGGGSPSPNGGNGPGSTTNATGSGGMVPAGVCGDGLLDPGEACDDGNQVDADGCEADCSLPACGNGIVDPGELCFDAPAVIALEGALIHFGPRLLDCDADGDLDLVQIIGPAIFEPTIISVLINDGNGSFGLGDVQSSLGPVHEFYASFAIGALDDQAGLDLGFVGQPFASKPSLRIFSAKEGCRFVKTRTRDLGEPHVFPIALPIDGDDHDDLVMLRPQSQTVGVSLSGTGYPVTPIGPPALRLAPPTQADLDGDGRPEVLVADTNGGRLLVHRNLEALPWLSGPVPTPAGPSPYTTAAGDLDLDGRTDVIVLGRGGQLNRLLGNGNGGLGPVTSFPTGLPEGSSAADVVLGDLDADGDLDVLLTGSASGSTTLDLRLNDGDGAFVAPANSTLFTSYEGEATVTTLAVADLDGDGALDVLVTTYVPRGGFEGLARIHILLAKP